MSDSVSLHRDSGPDQVRVAVVTISDTRMLKTDTSGALIVQMLEEAGHEVVGRVLIRDEPAAIERVLLGLGQVGDAQAALLTGGTGISPRDQTFETVSGLLTRTLPGYGELFRMLSYAEIGSAAMLSRALGGLIGEMVVLVMPGSKGAVRLAMEKLILPELPHLVSEARKR